MYVLDINQRERHNVKSSDKNSIKLIQESMTVNTTPIKILAQNKKNGVKEIGPTQENERCRFTLKKLEEKKYHFLDYDVPSMLEDLLHKKVIELPECKIPEEMGHVNDLNYCHYY